MNLIIDTSKNTIVSLGEFREESDERAQVVLPLLQTLLSKNNLTLSSISNIQVITNPQSFTGQRVTHAIAGMLAHLLAI